MDIHHIEFDMQFTSSLTLQLFLLPDEVYMTSVSWVVPPLEHQPVDDKSPSAQADSPNINTCRPMSYQEDGAKVSSSCILNCKGAWVIYSPKMFVVCDLGFDDQTLVQMNTNL